MSNDFDNLLFLFAGDGMSPVMFENILKELSNLVNENDLHVSQVSHCQAFCGIPKVLSLAGAKFLH